MVKNHNTHKLKKKKCHRTFQSTAEACLDLTWRSHPAVAPRSQWSKHWWANMYCSCRHTKEWRSGERCFWWGRTDDTFVGIRTREANHGPLDLHSFNTAVLFRFIALEDNPKWMFVVLNHQTQNWTISHCKRLEVVFSTGDFLLDFQQPSFYACVFFGGFFLWPEPCPVDDNALMDNNLIILQRSLKTKLEGILVHAWCTEQHKSFLDSESIYREQKLE